SNEMAELARNYHDDLQGDGNEITTAYRDTATRRVLRTLDNETEPPNMTELETNLGEADVHKALNEAARGKASGMDGIPTEFWLRMRNIYRETQKGDDGPEEQETCDIVKILTHVYNDIEEHGMAEGTQFAAGW
ncbi:hypothetical protein C8F01DRAFT_922230, partial [Mycena amicta]